jgi:hypothetical protein
LLSTAVYAYLLYEQKHVGSVALAGWCTAPSAAAAKSMRRAGSAGYSVSHVAEAIRHVAFGHQAQLLRMHAHRDPLGASGKLLAASAHQATLLLAIRWRGGINAAPSSQPAAGAAREPRRACCAWQRKWRYGTRRSRRQ